MFLSEHWNRFYYNQHISTKALSFVDDRIKAKNIADGSNKTDRQQTKLLQQKNALIRRNFDQHRLVLKWMESALNVVPQFCSNLMMLNIRY